MTEAEWLTSEDTEEMRTALAILGATSHRRLCLVGCACCRRLWKLMTDNRSRMAVEGTELFVDEQLSHSEYVRRYESAKTAWEAMPYDMSKTNTAAAVAAVAVYTSSEGFDINGLSNAMGAAVEAFPKKARKVLEERSQATLLRDIFGNPFRSVTFSPEWRTDTALSLARGMYDSRDFSVMPILADALQDAGCDSDDILSHCRSEGTHVRGCWVVDMLLGKA